MNASYPIRPIAMSELPQFMRVGEHAFNSNWPQDQVMAWEKMVFEVDRSLAAFDGDEIVGTATAISFDLTVPGGGQVGVAGVTGVSVLPSHRRQGVLSSLMNRQLADVAAGSEPVAALFASESVIYGRYGYGVATRHLHYTIKRGETLLPAPANRPRLRICEPKDAVGSLKPLYDAVQATRPGMLTRHKAYWDVALADPEFIRDGSGPERCLVAEDETGPRGYALYSVKPKWSSSGLPDGELYVQELFALDRDTALTLWADLFSRDLVGEIGVRSRPLDDPLLHELADPRRTRAIILDGLYIRLVDLPVALTSRSYSSAVDVVIEVTDDRLPANAGRWHLTAGGPADGVKPTCERTTAEPDLVMPVVALGSAYLGGTRLGSLADAGVVAEVRPGALMALSTAMWWDPAPWAPTSF
ncbi:MAG TPA: GNAT family N-acetyltransferase [Streptosporangiaceae bacterium]|nr:GNAT family N-acetyltransferase [Streptosporangiaceae bacterium]